MFLAATLLRATHAMASHLRVAPGSGGSVGAIIRIHSDTTCEMTVVLPAGLRVCGFAGAGREWRGFHVLLGNTREMRFRREDVLMERKHSGCKATFRQAGEIPVNSEYIKVKRSSVSCLGACFKCRDR